MALSFSYKLASSLEGGQLGSGSEAIEVASHGTSVDQARKYWLEVYVSDSTATNVVLSSIDLTLDIQHSLFTPVTDSSLDLRYSDEFDLFRSSRAGANANDSVGFGAYGGRLKRQYEAQAIEKLNSLRDPYQTALNSYNSSLEEAIAGVDNSFLESYETPWDSYYSSLEEAIAGVDASLLESYETAYLSYYNSLASGELPEDYDWIVQGFYESIDGVNTTLLGTDRIDQFAEVREGSTSLWLKEDLESQIAFTSLQNAKDRNADEYPYNGRQTWGDFTLSISETVDTSSQVRFSQGAASEMAGQGAPLISGLGMVLGAPDQFIGRIELDVNDAQLLDAGLSANLSDYIDLRLNLDETILVSTLAGDSTRTIQSLREYGPGYSVLGSSVSIERVSGQFAVEVANAPGTQLKATAPDVFTNLLRHGQTVSSEFVIANVGKAGLIDVALNMSGVSFDGYQLLAANYFKNDIAIEVSDVPGFSGQELALGRGADGLLNGVADVIRASYSMKVDALAGDVAQIAGLDNFVLSAAGLDVSVVLADEVNTSAVKNLITFQGDLNYDGKVGMRDLAALNHGASLAAKGQSVHADVDANFDGELDLNDLAILASDWGASLWNASSGAAEYLGSHKITTSELSQQGDYAWNNAPFDGEASNVLDVGYAAASGAPYSHVDVNSPTPDEQAQYIASVA